MYCREEPSLPSLSTFWHTPNKLLLQKKLSATAGSHINRLCQQINGANDLQNSKTLEWLEPRKAWTWNGYLVDAAKAQSSSKPHFIGHRCPENTHDVLFLQSSQLAWEVRRHRQMRARDHRGKKKTSDLEVPAGMSTEHSKTAAHASRTRPGGIVYSLRKAAYTTDTSGD